MPTEAEWDYAARAGTATATAEGDLDVEDCRSSAALDPIAWYCGNSDDETHRVASLRPDGFGLFDMLGNVHELCSDASERNPGDAAVVDPFGPPVRSARVARGGSFHGAASASRAASHGSVNLDTTDWSLGVRPARTLF